MGDFFFWKKKCNNKMDSMGFEHETSAIQVSNPETNIVTIRGC